MEKEVDIEIMLQANRSFSELIHSYNIGLETERLIIDEAIKLSEIGFRFGFNTATLKLTPSVAAEGKKG